MLRAILSFCIRERLIVLVIIAGVVGYGWYATTNVPIDAIPNVGENQVIVLTEWPGRSPKDVEDQITYPLSIALQSVPGAKSVRGKSMFGYSFVQVTFEDSTDFYWARSRVSEQLGTVGSKLPAGVTPTLGPDATALGQIYYYALEPPRGMNLAELRSLQDYVIKYELQSVEGVAEVASVGGYVRQYQIEVDPDKLRFHNLPLSKVVAAVKSSNLDVGAKTVESSGMEFIVRGMGFLGRDQNPAKAIKDIEQTVIASRDGVPIRIRDVAQVQLGPDFRRGAVDLNGSETVGGVVVMRYGENPRAVIERVKEKIAAIEPSLKGVKVHGIYDRTLLIDETIETLTTALTDEILITMVVILLFLLHVRASVVVAVTLPVAVLIAFIGMDVFGIDANIMSLAGIAIAIGTMVDMAIIVSENIYQHLADWEADGSPGGDEARSNVIREAACEVIPAVMTAVGTTIVSFLPVFFLTGRDHRLFAPLAWTKTFSLAASLIVAVLVVPMLCRVMLRSQKTPWWISLLAGSAFGAILAGTCWFVWGETLSVRWNLAPEWSSVAAFATGFALGVLLTREKLRPMDGNPVSRVINTVYDPALRFCMAHKALFFAVPIAIVVLGAGAWVGLPKVLQPVEKVGRKVGAELNDVPGYVTFKHSFTGLKSDDWIALDEGSWFYMPSLYPAASFSEAMRVLQTQDVLIKQIPEVQHVFGKIGRVESALDPAPAAMVETYVMLKPKSEWRPGITRKDIWDEINRVATLPGVTPASPLQPIEGRVVMLQSGIKAPMAIRVYGDDLDGLAKAAREVARHLKASPYVNPETVNPDIVLGKPYVEFDVDRDTTARYGMSTVMVNRIIETALGGMNLTKTVEGRERYPVRIRYQRNLRDRIDDLKRLPVVTHTGEIVPLERLARMRTTWGPGAINSENARLVAHISFSTSGDAGDLESVAAIEKSLRDAQSKPKGDPDRLNLPDGYNFDPVGSFQNQVEANNRLMWIVPTVLAVCFFLIYLEFRNRTVTKLVFAGIPVAFAGGMIFLGIQQVEMNTAIWIGFIALFGIAVDDGVVMATYLQQVFSRRDIRSVADIRAATAEAGRRRIRPCLMTTVTTLVALVPVLSSTGRGADVAKAMAWPVFGGMVVELVTLFVVPVLYCSYQESLLAERAGEYPIEAAPWLSEPALATGATAGSAPNPFREE